MPSPAPVKPRPSSVVAFTLTCSGPVPKCQQCFPPFGRCSPAASASGRSWSHPRCTPRIPPSTASPHKGQELPGRNSLVPGSVSGKCWPMSLKPAAPAGRPSPHAAGRLHRNGPPGPARRESPPRLISASGLPSGGVRRIRVHSHVKSPAQLPGRSRSCRVVTLKFSSSPSTSRTFMPSRSTAAQSSVTAAPSFSAWDSAPGEGQNQTPGASEPQRGWSGPASGPPGPFCNLDGVLHPNGWSGGSVGVGRPHHPVDELRRHKGPGPVLHRRQTHPERAAKPSCTEAWRVSPPVITAFTLLNPAASQTAETGPIKFGRVTMTICFTTAVS